MKTLIEKSNIIQTVKSDTFCTFPVGNGFCLRSTEPFEWRCSYHRRLYVLEDENDDTFECGYVMLLFPVKNKEWGECLIDLHTRYVYKYNNSLENNSLENLDRVGRLLCYYNEWFMN
jgi:hypothetical protein